MMKKRALVLVALVALLCTTAFAGESSSSIRGEEVEYEVGDAKLTGFIAWDENVKGARPGGLIVHEWWGHNDYVRKRAKMLAEMGYTAFALDMYGDGKYAEHPGDAQKFMMEVLSNMDVGVARFEAAKKLLEEHATTDSEQTAAIGYCFGGAVVLHMARIGADLDAVASFHGTLSTQSPAQKGAVKARLLVEHGAADPFIPAAQVEAFKKEMADAEADMTFHAYEGAKHAFTNPEATSYGEKFGLPLEYDEEADKKSWSELGIFLAEVFGD